MTFYPVSTLGPGGPAGGDLTGTYPNPQVAGAAGAVTFNGAMSVNAVLSYFGAGSGTNSAGVANNHAITPTFANGVASKLSDTGRDYMVYFTIGTAGTAFSVAIGPTASPANTIYASSVATGGDKICFRLPANWFVQWSATTATLAAQSAIGC